MSPGNPDQRQNGPGNNMQQLIANTTHNTSCDLIFIGGQTSCLNCPVIKWLAGCGGDGKNAGCTVYRSTGGFYSLSLSFFGIGFLDLELDEPVGTEAWTKKWD